MRLTDGISAGITASVVSHGQIELVNALIGDLIRYASAPLRRLVVTLNVPEPAPAGCGPAPFEIRIVRNERPLGFGANHNRAFLHCDTPWFAVLNPDLRFQSDALGLLLASSEPGDGLLAPLVLNADGTAADAARRLPTPAGVLRRRLRPRSNRPDPDFDWLAGMCLLVNAEAFRSLGGFDERFFMYCEDTDLSLRMQLAGWRLRQVPGVSLVHDARRQSRRSGRHLRWHVASMLRLWASPVFRHYARQRDELGPLRQVGLSRERLQGP